MPVLKKLGVMSVAKIQAILMAVFGLILGFITALWGTTLGAMSGSTAIGAGIGFFAIIVFPILYAIIGFVTGAVGAFLYNLFAKWVGGIEMEFEKS